MNNDDYGDDIYSIVSSCNIRMLHKRIVTCCSVQHNILFVNLCVRQMQFNLNIYYYKVPQIKWATLRTGAKPNAKDRKEHIELLTANVTCT